MQGVVEFLRSASTAIGCSLGGIIIVELIVIFNIARLRTKIIDENKNAKNGEKRTTAAREQRDEDIQRERERDR